MLSHEIRRGEDVVVTCLNASWAKSTAVPGGQLSHTLIGSRISALCEMSLPSYAGIKTGF